MFVYVRRQPGERPLQVTNLCPSGYSLIWLMISLSCLQIRGQWPCPEAGPDLHQQQGCCSLRWVSYCLQVLRPKECVVSVPRKLLIVSNIKNVNFLQGISWKLGEPDRYKSQDVQEDASREERLRPCNPLPRHLQRTLPREHLWSRFVYSPNFIYLVWICRWDTLEESNVSIC